MSAAATGVVRLRSRGLPSVWRSYPFVVLNRRPPVESVKAPLEFTAVAERVAFKARRLERFARACGFSDPAIAALVYPHVLAMPLHLKIFGSAQFALRPMGLIHLANVIEPIASFEDGQRLRVEVTARNYQRTDIGMTFDVETQISSAGRTLWRERCQFLSRYTVPPEGASRPPRPPRAPRDAQVLEELEVTLRTAWQYARVSVDFNPIHLNERAARYFGLRGAIAHGMWSLARSVAVAPPAAGYPAGGRLDTQFLSPVQLPARIAIKQWEEGGKLRRAACDLRTGRVHMYASWSAPD